MLAEFFVRLITKTKIIQHINFTLTSHIDAVKFKVPVLAGVGKQNLTITEPWMIDLFRRHQASFGTGTFLDIGANLGQTLIKYKTVFPENRYIGFEPNLTCAFYVTKLVESNRWRNCQVFSTAVGDQTNIKELFFYYDEDVDAGASLIEGFRPDERVLQTVRIPVLKLDDVGKSEDHFGRVGCIKIDVEGGEYDVIKGCRQIIEKHRPLLLAEILPAYDAANVARVGRQQEIENILHAIDYTLYVVEKDDHNRLKGLTRIETIGIQSDLRMSDYLFVPREAGFQHSMVTP